MQRWPHGLSVSQSVSLCHAKGDSVGFSDLCGGLSISWLSKVKEIGIGWSAGWSIAAAIILLSYLAHTIRIFVCWVLLPSLDFVSTCKINYVFVSSRVSSFRSNKKKKKDRKIPKSFLFLPRSMSSRPQTGFRCNRCWLIDHSDRWETGWLPPLPKSLCIHLEISIPAEKHYIKYLKKFYYHMKT